MLSGHSDFFVQLGSTPVGFAVGYSDTLPNYRVRPDLVAFFHSEIREGTYRLTHSIPPSLAGGTGYLLSYNTQDTQQPQTLGRGPADPLRRPPAPKSSVPCDTSPGPSCWARMTMRRKSSGGMWSTLSYATSRGSHPKNLTRMALRRNPRTLADGHTHRFRWRDSCVYRVT